MKIPKYIEKALQQRENSACKLIKADTIITDFIIKNNICAESYDYCSGVEMYCNPYESANRIREAILNTEK